MTMCTNEQMTLESVYTEDNSRMLFYSRRVILRSVQYRFVDRCFHIKYLYDNNKDLYSAFL